MKKNYVIVSLIIMLALFVIGLRLLFNSTSIGQKEGQRTIEANGGSMDTQQYNSVINNTTENYRVGGMIISLVG